MSTEVPTPNDGEEQSPPRDTEFCLGPVNDSDDDGSSETAVQATGDYVGHSDQSESSDDAWRKPIMDALFKLKEVLLCDRFAMQYDDKFKVFDDVFRAYEKAIHQIPQDQMCNAGEYWFDYHPLKCWWSFCSAYRYHYLGLLARNDQNRRKELYTFADTALRNAEQLILNIRIPNTLAEESPWFTRMSVSIRAERTSLNIDKIAMSDST